MSAHQQGSLIRVDLRLAGCVWVCTAVQPIGATRVRLDPSVDPQHPPSVEVNGQLIKMEPWMP